MISSGETSSPDLRHVVDTQEDEGGEDQTRGEDQEEDVTESEKLLVDGGLAGPCCRGHHLESCMTQTVIFFSTECCALLSRGTSHWR